MFESLFGSKPIVNNSPRRLAALAQLNAYKAPRTKKGGKKVRKTQKKLNKRR